MANVTEVLNIVTLRTITGTGTQTVEVLGYYAANDGGGGIFYWKVTPTVAGDDNGGTIIVKTGVTTGRWERIYDGFIDVKWFGAKGDGATNDTVNFQKALTFISNNTTKRPDLYISRGRYIVYPPSSGADCLYLDVSSGQKNIDIYGDGANVSKILYEYHGAASTTFNIFRIVGDVHCVSSIHDFSIEGIDIAGRSGKGLVLEHMQLASIENVSTVCLHTGMDLFDFLMSSFKNVWLSWGAIGLKIQPSTFTLPPNLILFESCGFGSNTDVGVDMDVPYGLHSVSFLACSFEGNGTREVSTAGAIRAKFTGINGANGLNIANSYFEGNKGGYDIKLYANGFGSHTFSGNTFNRLSEVDFTTNNILIDGDGQSTQPDFGFSKTKLVFQGNGFLPTNSYTPSASRRTIEVLNTNPDYWQYDIVEEGNNYIGIVDAPVFNTKTPQVSEYTRVKAFGRIYGDGSGYLGEYNIASVERNGAGTYTISFANPIPKIYVANITPIGNSLIPLVAFENPTQIQVVLRNTSGIATDSNFNITLH